MAAFCVIGRVKRGQPQSHPNPLIRYRHKHASAVGSKLIRANFQSDCETLHT